MKALLPEDEPESLEALGRYRILDPSQSDRDEDPRERTTNQLLEVLAVFRSVVEPGKKIEGFIEILCLVAPRDCTRGQKRFSRNIRLPDQRFRSLPRAVTMSPQSGLENRSV